MSRCAWAPLAALPGKKPIPLRILLCEHAATIKNPPKIQIFATDIDERGLEIARKGPLPGEHRGKP